jgi:hypothetical protein
VLLRFLSFILLPRAHEELIVSTHWNSISSFPNRWRVTPDAAGIAIAKTRSNVDRDGGGFAIPVARKRNYVQTAFLFQRWRAPQTPIPICPSPVNPLGRSIGTSSIRARCSPKEIRARDNRSRQYRTVRLVIGFLRFLPAFEREMVDRVDRW